MARRLACVAAILGMTLVFGGCAATPTSTHEIIGLEHADCRDIRPILRKLSEDSESGHKLVVVTHPKSNSILLSGTRKQIVRAKDLIARLDRPKK